MSLARAQVFLALALATAAALSQAAAQAAPGTAQAPAAQGRSAARRVAVFEFVPLAGSSAAYARLFADSLALELERQGYRIVPAAQLKELLAVPATDLAAALTAARFAGADVAVVGFYLIQGQRLRIGARAIDLASEAVALSAEAEGAAGFDIFDTIDALSADLAARVRVALEPILKPETIVEREEIIVETVVVEEILELGTPITITLLSSDEGAVLRAVDPVRDDPELGVVVEGRLKLATKEGAALALIVSKDGYYPRRLSFTASAAEPERALPRLTAKPVPELFFRASLDRPFGLEAGLRRYLFSESLGLEASVGFFFVPYAYPQFMRFGVEPYIDEPGGALDLSLGAAAALYPLSLLAPSSRLRPFIHAGLASDLSAAFAAGASLPPVAWTLRGTGGLGLRYGGRGYSVAFALSFASPVMLSLGALQGTESPMALRLSAEVALPW